MTSSPHPVDAGPRWGRLSRRRGGPLDVERARSRTSAFVYGNSTTLGALAAVDSAMVGHGTAALAVAVTALATFVAHVIADAVSSGIVPAGTSARSEGNRRALAHEVRDAGPIASSASVPVLLLLLGWWEVLSPTTAQLAAAVVVVVRLGAIGFVVERLSGRRASLTTFLSGVVLAAVSLVIAVAKAVLGH